MTDLELALIVIARLKTEQGLMVQVRPQVLLLVPTQADTAESYRARVLEAKHLMGGLLVDLGTWPGLPSLTGKEWG